VKIFRSVRRFVTEPRTPDSVRLFKNLLSSLATAAPRPQARLTTTVESNALREFTHRVFLNRSRRPRLLRPARFKKRGGRANRRRCARWRCFPGDCWVVTHSNMGNGILCRIFSQVRHSCFAGVEQERSAQIHPAKAEGRPRGLVSLNLGHTREDNLPRAIGVGTGRLLQCCT
jgi:hypothetical protein